MHTTPLDFTKAAAFAPFSATWSCESRWIGSTAPIDHQPVAVRTRYSELYEIGWKPIDWRYNTMQSCEGYPYNPYYECKEALELDSTPEPVETAGQLWARRESMQAEAASLLGQMLFAFSYIDMNLGLCLAWVDNGTKLDPLSKSVEGQNIHTKLDTLSRQVAKKLPAGSKRRATYERWIERVHAARVQRNQMVHGRWGIEAHRHKVVNVIGLPSGTQQSIEYTLSELTAFNEELRALERELARLREHWPL